MRRGFLFFAFLILGTFSFSVGFSRASGPTVVPTTISKAMTWTKENSPYIIQSNVYVQAKLTIEPGTVVKFSQPVYSLYINAEFSARGTKNEKVVFTSIHDDSAGGNSDAGAGERDPRTPDWEKININPNVRIEFDNAIIRYGRVALWATSTSAEHENLIIRNSEISHAVTGIYMENVEPVIENNLITDNSTGVTFFANSGLERNLTLSYNSFSGNGSKAVYGFNTNHLGEVCVNAKNNWWNDASGPKDPIGNPSGKGNAVNSPEVAYDPWQGKNTNTGLDPVVVIPGIMGSWQVDGKWTIDPIFHTYDNLRDEFLANGYEDGKNFFTFPYEWRNSNVDNAKLLEKKIEEIKKDTGRPKVDIVAHSMGGLLAREYIESDYYGNDVDQLITVGTPQLGAPKDYIKWEAGESFFDVFDMAAKRFLALEALENGYFNIYDYIHEKPISSVQELLPTYNYLYDAEKSNVLRESYPNNYPRNEFLERLNNSSKTQSLKNTEFTEIIGKTNSETSTVSSYNVASSDKQDIWKHGYPKYFDIPVLNRQGITKGIGDGTVTLVSAEASDIFTDRKIYLQSEHNALPTDAQKDILEILTGKRPTNEMRGSLFGDMLIATVHSPVDIQIQSPSGEKIGKNFETGGTYDEIEGAYYSGFDTNTEFLTIPNPEDGEYKILTEGTGTGDYTIETAKIAQNETTGEASESIAKITGTAEPQVQEENKIKIDGDSVKKVEPLMLSPKNKEEKNSVETAGIVLGTSQFKESSGTTQDQISVATSNDQKSKIQQLDDLRNSVLGYFKTNQIKSRKEAAAIVKNLGHIRVHLKNYEILGKKSRLPQKALLGAKTKANRHIDGLSSHISRNSPKKIDEGARNDLIESLNSLKIVV